MESKTAEIKLTINLDAQKLPTRIEWVATDAASDRAAGMSVDDVVTVGCGE